MSLEGINRIHVDPFRGEAGLELQAKAIENDIIKILKETLDNQGNTELTNGDSKKKRMCANWILRGNVWFDHKLISRPTSEIWATKIERVPSKFDENGIAIAWNEKTKKVAITNESAAYVVALEVFDMGYPPDTSEDKYDKISVSKNNTNCHNSDDRTSISVKKFFIFSSSGENIETEDSSSYSAEGKGRAHFLDELRPLVINQVANVLIESPDIPTPVVLTLGDSKVRELILANQFTKAKDLLKKILPENLRRNGLEADRYRKGGDLAKRNIEQDADNLYLWFFCQEASHIVYYRPEKDTMPFYLRLYQQYIRLAEARPGSVDIADGIGRLEMRLEQSQVEDFYYKKMLTMEHNSSANKISEELKQ
ncbi:MAG: hypothetical protein HQL71_14320 [Magnetococcales bacterium]|nr:hypothetical protein [Magnetococcales bacterium]